MVMCSVNRPGYRFCIAGMSLVELLAATSIGMLLLLSVGSLFISGQRAAAATARELLLSQSMAQTLNYIRDDARRAGYNLAKDQPLKLSGAATVIQISSDVAGNHRLAYVYALDDTKSELVVFASDLAEKKLKLCTKKIPAASTPTEADCTVFQSLLDQNLLQLTDFSVNETLFGRDSSSAFITVSMAIQLTDNPASRQSRTIAFKQRN